MYRRRFCTWGRNSPALISDEGYLNCQGLAPGDQEVISRLHPCLAPLVEPDLALYPQSRRSERVARASRLKAQVT
jgi:hypothetical protein